jgi:hypothetical protein
MSTTTPGANPEERAGRESLGQLLTEVSRDISRLFRQEVELAKAEIRDSATKAGRGAGLLGGAGVAGHFALLFLSIAVWWSLGDLIGLGWSAVIVAVVYAIAAAILAVAGRNQIREVRGMPQTAETVKRIPDALTPEERT